MEKFVYAALLGGVGWVVGSAAFGAYVFARLVQHVKGSLKRRYLYLATAMGAFGFTSAILLYALVNAGTAEATWRGWAYAVGSFITGYAFTGVGKSGVDELARYEINEWANGEDAQRHRSESSEQRLVSLESHAAEEVERQRND